MLHKLGANVPLALMFAIGNGWALPFTDYPAFCTAQGPYSLLDRRFFLFSRSWFPVFLRYCSHFHLV